MMRSSMPLLLTPSLTRKSRATVIIPLFEKPSRHSFGCRMPAQSIITTQLNRMSPGFNLSAMSAQIMNTKQKATKYTLNILSEQFSYSFYYSADGHEFYLVLFLVEPVHVMRRNEDALESKLLCLRDSLFYS